VSGFVPILAWLPQKELAEEISAERMLALVFPREPAEVTKAPEKRGTVWADYPAPTARDLDFLKANFHFHPLALQIVRRNHEHRAQVTNYGENLFLVWPVAMESAATGEVEVESLFFFLGPNYLISLHARPLPVLDKVSRETVDDREIAIEGPDWLLLRVLDESVSSYFPTLDALSDRLDGLEDVMFREPGARNLEDLFAIKRSLATLRRTAAPERDVVNSLARHESGLIDDNTFVYFQDVYDHLSRVTDGVDTSRDVVNGAMDIYLSSISNRMNDIMKRLTVVATIFLPITFITSMYGMNFRFMPGLRSPIGFHVAAAAMVIIVVAMLADFRRRGWW